MTITCTVSRGKPRPAISRAHAHRRGLWENGGRMRRDRALSQCKAGKRARWTGGASVPGQGHGAQVQAWARTWHVLGATSSTKGWTVKDEMYVESDGR